MKKTLISGGLLAFAAVLVSVASCGTVPTSSVASSTSAASSTAATGKTWAESYDAAVAAAQKETDATKRFAILHKTEDLLMNTGAACPIYYYTEKLLQSSKISGFYETASGYKFYRGASKTDGSTTLTACLASEPDTIDPALNSSVDGACYIANAFEGLYTFKNVDGAVKLQPGEATGYTKTTVNGKITYTFTMRDGLKWSDGSTHDANDYVYAWNRAASGVTAADYGYLFGYIDNYANVAAYDGTDATAKYKDEKLGMVASADGKTLTVTMDHDCPYFEQLLAFPTFMPVKKAAIDAAATASTDWASEYGNVQYYVSNGAFKLSSRTKDSNLTFVKNTNYYDASTVSLATLVFALSDDTDANFTNFTNGQYDMVDGVPVAKIAKIKTDYPTEFKINPQLGTYYITFNVNSKTFSTVANTETKRESLRKGLARLIDRNYITNSVTQGSEVPANTMVDAGISDADGVTKFHSKSGLKGDGAGYYSVTAADLATVQAEGVEMIKAAGYTYDTATKKFTNVPTFTYLYNTSDSHKAIAEAIQSQFAQFGITMNLKNQAWATFLTTRKSGEYDVARDGWLADYDDPSSYLEMFTSDSGNNDPQLGKGDNAAYAGYTPVAA